MTSWEDITHARWPTATSSSLYTALFTRIDPKLIDAMTDASKDTLAAAAALWDLPL